jgi:sulfofructose kinase
MFVAGIGQCCLDYLIVVNSYPRVDTKNEVLEWYQQGGGPVATALAALSRLGIQCKFFGIIGDDYAGKAIKQSLIKEGIDVSYLIKRENTISQLAFIVIERGTAKRTIFWKRPTGEPLQQEDLRDDFLKGIDFLLLDGLMEDISICAAKKARALKVPVMLDAGKVRPGMLEIARLSDYVIASEEFAKDLGWHIDATVLHKEKEKIGVKVLTITLGEQGSITISGDQVFQIPAFKVKALDTTGAGDVFHGGYIYGLLQGWDLRDTVIFASALSALKCTKIGGRAGIPKSGEVIEFLKEKGFTISQNR